MICGSEDHFIYLWKTQHEFYKFSSARRDRNDYYEAVKGKTILSTYGRHDMSSSSFLQLGGTGMTIMRQLKVRPFYLLMEDTT